MDALTENKKENIYVAVPVEKQQRKKKTERKWKANEETGSILRELKTVRCLVPLEDIMCVKIVNNFDKI